MRRKPPRTKTPQNSTLRGATTRTCNSWLDRTQLRMMIEEEEDKKAPPRMKEEEQGRDL